MCEACNMKDLGFTKASIPDGAHLCQIYSNESEREESLLKFVEYGLKNNEKTACFTDSIDDGYLEEYFEKIGISLSDSRGKSAFSSGKTSDVYFSDKCFNPERMLGIVEKFYQDSREEKFNGARIIGEMTPKINEIEGGTKIFEYESRINILLERCPLTAICQYDAREFGGKAIMEILNVHPFMIVRGKVLNNPFFVKPEVYLQKVSLS